MTTASPGGAGGCTSGRASESRASFFDTLFQKSCVELEKAKPFDRSRVDIAAIASLDGVDPGDCEVAPLSCSVLSPKLATGDAEIDAGSPLRSRLTRLEPHPAMAVQAEEIKEEGEDEEVAIIADPRDAAAVSPSCSLRAAARLMERLGVAGPAPFLRKTYDMVSDPGTDPMVSWGSSRDSFVVWDQHEFSKQVLPGYFKHSNFSSFIRQLNTYGFRKIDSDRWEFANKGFQEGKKHLLNNIKRRGKFSNHTKPWSSTVTLDYPKGGKEAELEMLKKDGEAVKAEILKLREERENLQRELNQVAKRIRHAECRHWRMLLFLSKAAKSPNLDQHLIQERRQKRELETCESSKKSKLLGPDSEATECLLQVIDHKIRSPNVDCLRIIDDSAQMESRPDNVVPEDFETVQMRNWWPPPMGGGDFRDQMAGTSRSDLPSVLHEMREKLLGDNVIVGDVAEDAVQVEEELLAAELESLIEKPCGWSEYTSELGEQAAGLMP